MAAATVTLAGPVTVAIVVTVTVTVAVTYPGACSNRCDCNCDYTSSWIPQVLVKIAAAAVNPSDIGDLGQAAKGLPKGEFGIYYNLKYAALGNICIFCKI